jgi:hypothetical protein
LHTRRHKAPPVLPSGTLRTRGSSKIFTRRRRDPVVPDKKRPSCSEHEETLILDTRRDPPMHMMKPYVVLDCLFYASKQSLLYISLGMFSAKL